MKIILIKVLEREQDKMKMVGLLAARPVARLRCSTQTKKYVYKYEI